MIPPEYLRKTVDASIHDDQRVLFRTPENIVIELCPELCPELFSFGCGGTNSGSSYSPAEHVFGWCIESALWARFSYAYSQGYGERLQSG